MIFRFLGNNNSNELPDQQLLNEIGYLSNFEDEALEQLIENVFEFMIIQKAEDLMKSISDFSQQHSVNENTIKNIVRGCIVFFKGSAKNNLTPDYVKEDLINFKLSEDQAKIVSLKYKQHFIDLSRSLVGNSLSIQQVLDMQWRFGVTTSSSEFTKSNTTGSTFLQLKLVLDKGNNIKEDVHMELTLPQFYEFLKQMQSAKQSLEYLN
ncbi:hypothetical protein DICPUDRAFT_38509 [Dictyostelium purpureum]|uniref:COMM domain-containing protein n=1 Tax=Dictyostelium purpureum TaxID=5786 RepID=F0ZUK6_DICPU|nr:uncharacterized protein DICPUDRAFT_38509 [Dictyostelium purpureum]EGC32367.1 hypothetical protein DICPUDRAFT_38509 [Dictyostelium purpureum]|eukprot:XP_003291097.1 hypothetical protein DICPUDRAFT_38509 [Dictyostelium purpureum]